MSEQAHCTEHERYDAACRWCRLARRDEISAALAEEAEREQNTREKAERQRIESLMTRAAHGKAHEAGRSQS